MKYRYQSLVLSTVILVFAVSMVVIGTRGPKKVQFTKSLEQLIPSSGTLDDWSMARRPIAETAEVKAMVDELINFDDALYVRFTRKDWWIDIYIAYWRPGKMSYRAIAGHTPDVCWVGQGWNCQLRGTEQMISGEDKSTPGHLMQHRIYSLSGEIVNVVFCHIVDGKEMSYQTPDGVPPWHSMFTDLWNRGLWQKKEQLFLRISSNRMLGDIRDAPPVKKLLEEFEKAFPSTRRDSSGSRP